mgnify:CR=1 FL=1
MRRKVHPGAARALSIVLLLFVPLAAAAETIRNVPSVDVFNVPYLFRSHDHYWKVMTGPVGARIAADIDKYAEIADAGPTCAARLPGRKNA